MQLGLKVRSISDAGIVSEEEPESEGGGGMGSVS